MKCRRTIRRAASAAAAPKRYAAVKDIHVMSTDYVVSKKVKKSLFSPNSNTRTFKVTGAKARERTKQRQGEAVSQCLRSLENVPRRRGVAGRGHARNRISAERVWTHWKRRQKTLGVCPSWRTVSRLVHGINSICCRRHQTEELSQSEAGDLCRQARCQGWG